VADCLDSDNPILKVQQEGSTRYYRVTETPYGTVKSGLGRTIVLTDVTDRERYREELERQNERLEQFASLVSHDLRNPLNVATGRFELLREEVVMAADNENAEAVERALTRMDDLINQILTLAREGQRLSSGTPCLSRRSQRGAGRWSRRTLPNYGSMMTWRSKRTPHG